MVILYRSQFKYSDTAHSVWTKKIQLELNFKFLTTQDCKGIECKLSLSDAQSPNKSQLIIINNIILLFSTLFH